jgi:predicted DNA-binding transcriptional regulator YafY
MYPKTGKHKLAIESQLHRCLSIFRRLEDGQGLEVNRLAQDYNVSPRSIQRDLAALEAAGVPVTFTREWGQPVIWRLMEGV